MECWCPTQQMLGVFLRKEIAVKKLLLIGTVVLLTATSASAESPITYCISHGVNRASTWADGERSCWLRIGQQREHSLHTKGLEDEKAAPNRYRSAVPGNRDSAGCRDHPVMARRRL